MKPKIGLIGIIGGELEKDYWGTLQKVAAIGYQGLEVGGYSLSKAPVPLPEYKRRMDDLGLKIVTYHCDAKALETQMPEITAKLNLLECRFATISFGPCESRAQLLRDAETYNTVGRQLHKAGIQLCYHNHDHEFVRFDGAYGLDILLENTDPALLMLHLDIAWTTFGGADPIQMIRKYPGRCPLLHLKDFSRLEPGCASATGDRKQARFTEVGTGIVNLAGVAAVLEGAGVQWADVEQDRMAALPPMDSIRTSYANVKQAGLV